MSKEEWMKKNGKTQDEYESLPASMLRKTVLFIIISDSDSTFSFLSSILLQQLYELCTDRLMKEKTTGCYPYKVYE